MALTLMPRAAHSFASRRVMPARPLLLAVYEATRMPPLKESIEAMLMILPPRPACTRCFATACARKNGTLRLRFSGASQSSSLKVSASSRRMMPALFTRMSTRPASLMVCATTLAASCLRSRSACSAGNFRPAAVTPRSASAVLERATPTTSAPACARAIAMPCPRPVLAPVTSATLPCSENGFEGLGAVMVWVAAPASLELADVEDVHVGVIQVLAAHRPDEAVAASTGAHVNGPGRRDHGFFVLQHQTARLVGLAHEVHHALRALVLRRIFQVEVEIHLGAAVVQMRRHRVPDAARLEHRE